MLARFLSWELLVLSRSTLSAPGRYGGDISLEAFLVCAVSTRGEFDEGVQRDLHPGTLLLRDVHEVGVDAAQDGLVGDDDDVLAAFQLHDDRLQTDDDVAVGFAAAVAVVVLVFVAGGEVLRVALGDLLVGQAVADTRVELVEGLPLQLLVAGRLLQVASGLDGSLEGRSPDDDLGVLGDARLAKELGQGASVGFTTLRDVGVTTDLAGQVVLGFSVLEMRLVKRSSEVKSKTKEASYARQPDGARLDVEVLDVVHQAAGEVVLYLVDDDSRTDVDELDVGVRLLIVVDGFVGLFVVANAVAEVHSRQLRVLALIVRRGSLDFEDVVHDEILVIADGLDEESLDVSLAAPLVDPLAAFLGRVGGVQDSDYTLAGFEPAKHVSHGSLCGGPAHTLAFFIVGIEEGCSWLGCVVAAVATNVEDTGWDTHPSQIAHGWGRSASDLMTSHDTLTFAGYEALASGREAHHHDAYLGFIGLLGEISQVNPRHDESDERTKVMPGDEKEERRWEVKTNLSK